MAFRLTVVARDDLTVIRLDGRLVGASVADLEGAARAAARPLVLDLSHLVTADDAGSLALRRLGGEGVHLLGMSPYLTMLLGEGTLTLPTLRRRPGRAAGAGRRRRRGTPRSSGEGAR